MNYRILLDRTFYILKKMEVFSVKVILLKDEPSEYLDKLKTQN